MISSSRTSRTSSRKPLSRHRHRCTIALDWHTVTSTSAIFQPCSRPEDSCASREHPCRPSSSAATAARSACGHPNKPAEILVTWALPVASECPLGQLMAQQRQEHRSRHATAAMGAPKQAVAKLGLSTTLRSSSTTTTSTRRYQWRCLPFCLTHHFTTRALLCFREEDMPRFLLSRISILTAIRNAVERHLRQDLSDRKALISTRAHHRNAFPLLGSAGRCRVNHSCAAC